jgi:glycosyltransferase involved in cell wall biosynthesis
MIPPRVSVVIPAFNASATLRETVNSVLMQTFGDLECLVIDDGSIDDTNELVQKLAAQDARVRLLVHQRHGNHGTAQSRNLGLRCARGEFVAFLDADDAWLPDKLERQLKVMEDRPDVGFVFGDVYLSIDPDPSYPMSAQPLGKDPFRESMATIFNADDRAAARVMNLQLSPSNFIPSPTPLVRASLFSDGLEFAGPPLLNTMYEDFLMWRVLSMRTTFHCIQEPLAIYRFHRDNFTNQFKIKKTVVDHLLGIEEVEQLYRHTCADSIDAAWMPILRENQKTRLLDGAYRTPWRQLPRLLRLARQYGVATEVLSRRIRRGVYDLRYWQHQKRKRLLGKPDRG